MKFSNTIDDLNKRSSIFSTQSFLSAFHLKDSQSISYAVVLIAVCLFSRFLTSIYYIEDIDSLRFAHSLVEYDLTKLQPHFPGYPVFCLLAKILYGISGSMAFSFSLIGAFSVIVLVYALLRILNWQLRSLEGTILAVLIAANPLIWIMSNRYMPDLMGVACLFLGTYYIISGYRSSNNHQLLIGAILAGFLAGIRLSYIPFIAPLLLIIFIQTKERISFLIAGLGGVVIWLLPLIYLTGWDAFLASAMRQTSGHFGDFGGSIVTEPDSWKRLIETTRTIWADGLGGYWADRHTLTALNSVGILLAIGLAISKVFEARKNHSALLLLSIGCLCYLIWVFFGQNVIHKSRHILPVLTFVIILLSIGFKEFFSTNTISQIAGIVMLIAYMSIGSILAFQHKEPTAIEQIRSSLQDKSPQNAYIITIPLIRYYLTSHGIKATFLSVEDDDIKEQIASLEPNKEILLIGHFQSLMTSEFKVTETKTYFHNPYVNRMWASIPIYQYSHTPMPINPEETL